MEKQKGKIPKSYYCSFWDQIIIGREKAKKEEYMNV